jgi:tetratricopeptide (TPR) repeat protein
MAAAMEPSHASNRFFGREREREELRAGIKAAREARGRLFLVSGEAGIGKTRLADEISSEASTTGLFVVWGRCWEGGGAPAYWPFIQILRGCFKECDPEERRQLLGSEAAPQIALDLAELVPEFASTVPRPVPPTLRPEPTDAARARFKMFDSVATVLSNFARHRPLLIIVDDLHEADKSSLELLKFFAESLQKISAMVIGTYREEEVRASADLSRRIAELARASIHLPLGGLDRDEVAAMIESYAGVRPHPATVLSLFSLSAGNPLFVDSVVRVLIAENRLGEAFNPSLRIGENVRQVIKNRLDLLPDHQTLHHQTLHSAALLGSEFEVDLLSRVTGNEIHQLRDYLRDVAAAGIVVPIDAVRFRFAHGLIRESLSSELESSARAIIHERIVTTLEQLNQHDVRPRLAELAHHCAEAGLTGKAIDYSIRAGEAALAVCGYEDAIALFQTALDLMEHNGAELRPRGDLADRIADLMISTGTPETHSKAIDLQEWAARIFDELGDRQRAAEVHCKVGMAISFEWANAGTVMRAREHLRRAEPVLRDIPDSVTLAQFYRTLGSCSEDDVQIVESLNWFARSMDVANRVGDESEWSFSASRYGHTLCVAGRLTEGFALLERAYETGERVNHPLVPGLTLCFLAKIGIIFGLHREVQRRLLLELAKPQMVQNPGMSVVLHAWLFGSYLGTAELDEARNHANQAGSFAPLEILELIEGNWESAERRLHEKLAHSRRAGARYQEQDSLGWLADLSANKDDYQTAAEFYEMRLAIVSGQDLLNEFLTRTSLAKLLALQGRRSDEAHHHVHRCREILTPTEQWYRFDAEILVAEAVLAARNSLEEADSKFADALKIFRRYCCVWREIDLLVHWGSVLLVAGERKVADEKFDSAIEINRKCGAGERWIEWIDHMRTGSGLDMSHASHALPFESAKTESRRATFKREGAYWTLALGDRTIRLKDSRGLNYICHLLRHSGREFLVTDLVDAIRTKGRAIADAATPHGRRMPEIDTASDLGDSGPVLDAQAKAQYKRRRSELASELDEAERINDIGRAERIREEVDFLDEQLSAAIGLDGRDRRLASHSERARQTVTKRIKADLRRIREEHPPLGRLLEHCIRTGTICSYLPDPDHPVVWTF